MINITITASQRVHDVLSVETSIAQKMGTWINVCRFWVTAGLLAIGPLHDLVTWYGINYAAWDANNGVGLSK